MSKGKQRELLPIYAEGAVDEDLLQEGRRNIRDYFQRQGYFNADVQVSSHDDAEAGERVISYQVSRGDRFRLAGVAFIGNKYFSKRFAGAPLACCNPLRSLPAGVSASSWCATMPIPSAASIFRTVFSIAGHLHGGRQLPGKEKQSIRLLSHRGRPADAAWTNLRIEGNMP